jgi:hypothetical protein
MEKFITFLKANTLYFTALLKRCVDTIIFEIVLQNLAIHTPPRPLTVGCDPFGVANNRLINHVFKGIRYGC